MMKMATANLLRLPKGLNGWGRIFTTGVTVMGSRFQ